MKPVSLAFFFLIIIASILFAIIYVLWEDFVETYPAIFTIALLTSIITGMCGMMYNFIFNSTTEDKTIF